MVQSTSKRSKRQDNAPDQLRMYETMIKIRAFEEQANELYLGAKMPGLTHLYMGQEAVAVGVCEALNEDDYITSTHRGHGHCVAKGGELDRMFAELLGKAAGYCGGKGGSMHIADTQRGNLGANAIVGGSMGIATGAAMSSKMRKSGQVAVCFFGDGALGQGLLYEVMNMAQLWSLPIIYVCENNLYGEYTHYSENTAGKMLARPKAFNIHTAEVDGQNAIAVKRAMEKLVSRARNGKGPSFLLCNTYRYHGHHVGDIDRAYYRSKEEEQHWKTERDPIKIMGDWLVDQGIADVTSLKNIEESIYSDVDAAVEFALNAPFPELEEVNTNVYS